jgi:toxin-antitoxin system PIN domain toxin
MMALDTNVLVHAYREEMGKHQPALDTIHRLSEGDAPWALPGFCVSEFLRVVTHRQIFNPPTPLEEALASIESLLESSSIRLLLPGDRFWSIFPAVVRQGNAVGNVIYDAQIMALCLEHGVESLMSDDRDMRRFQGLQVLPIPPADRSS